MEENKGLFTKDDPRINRNGRPKKGETYTDLIRAMGEKEFPVKNKDGDTIMIPAKQGIVQKLFALALSDGKYSLPAAKYIIDRMDGTPNQKVEASGFLPLSDGFNMTEQEQEQFERFMKDFPQKEGAGKKGKRKSKPDKIQEETKTNGDE
jgi:hypothetical protein